MKIRNLSKYFGILVVFVGVFVGALVFTKNILIANGIGVLSIADDVEKLAKFDFAGVIKVDSEAMRVAGELAGENVELPVRYDSREENCGTANGCVGRVKDQQDEGICWAYAFTTVVESNLLRNGVRAELSAKHLDYLLADASLAMVESGALNKYSDRTNQLAGVKRQVGSGGNFVLTSYALSGKYALVSENKFFESVKNEKGFGFVDFSEVISLNGGKYNEKLSKNTILNTENVEYIVTDTDDFFLLKYGEDNVMGDESLSRAYMLQNVKEKIMENGAVELDSYFDLSNCGYVDASNNVTLIDKGATVCNAEKRHAMVLVGWDDEYTYDDNGVSKSGGFVVQNSSGEDFEETYRVMFGYDSEITVYAVNEVEKRSDYGEIFDFTDARDIYIEDGKIVYEFATDGEKKIKKIAATQRGFIGGDEKIEIYDADGNCVFEKTVADTFSGKTGFAVENVAVNGKFAVKLSKGMDFEDNMLKLASIDVLFEKEEEKGPSEEELDVDEEDEPEEEINGGEEGEMEGEKEGEIEKKEEGTGESEKRETSEKEEKSESNIEKEMRGVSSEEIGVPDTGHRTQYEDNVGANSGLLFAVAGVETAVIAFISVKIYKLVKK